MLKKKTAKTRTKNITKGLKDLMSKVLFRGEMKLIEPMKNHTSLRIGGAADVFAVPQDLTSLKNLIAVLVESDIPFIPLGRGTNVIVMDKGIGGAVICFKSFRRIGVLREDKEFAYLYVEAGNPLQRLVNLSKEKGYSGVEGLVGIPGTIGGAIYGNAGAFGYEMKDVVVSVDTIDRGGNVLNRRSGEIAFGYRTSGILPGEYIIGAEIKLIKDDKKNISSKTEDFLKIKQDRQPLWENSAGCVFKNPPGLSAGKLIDEAGCKGMRIGDIAVSDVHANFFINKKDAKASDFIRLMEKVSMRVEKKFGVVLEPEIKIVGSERA